MEADDWAVTGAGCSSLLSRRLELFNLTLQFDFTTPNGVCSDLLQFCRLQRAQFLQRPKVLCHGPVAVEQLSPHHIGWR